MKKVGQYNIFFALLLCVALEIIVGANAHDVFASLLITTFAYWFASKRLGNPKTHVMTDLKKLDQRSLERSSYPRHLMIWTLISIAIFLTFPILDVILFDQVHENKSIEVSTLTGFWIALGAIAAILESRGQMFHIFKELSTNQIEN